jgi:hypothetical protein
MLVHGHTERESDEGESRTGKLRESATNNISTENQEDRENVTRRGPLVVELFRGSATIKFAGNGRRTSHQGRHRGC